MLAYIAILVMFNIPGSVIVVVSRTRNQAREGARRTPSRLTLSQALILISMVRVLITAHPYWEKRKFRMRDLNVTTIAIVGPDGSERRLECVNLIRVFLS